MSESNEKGAMPDAERIERLDAMCDRLAAKAADLQEALHRVNAAVDFLLEQGRTSKDQHARAFANAHALVLIDALADHRACHCGSSDFTSDVPERAILHRRSSGCKTEDAVFPPGSEGQS